MELSPGRAWSGGGQAVPDRQAGSLNTLGQKSKIVKICLCVNAGEIFLKEVY